MSKHYSSSYCQHIIPLEWDEDTVTVLNYGGINIIDINPCTCNEKQDHTEYKYIIHVDTYNPPLWSTKFWRWFKHPEIWFTKSFDWLTVPFLMFVAIFYSIALAGIWQCQSKVLSQDIKPLLVKLSRQEDK